jgi:DNA (cytosine-5)-methyltransferase 1
MKNSKSPISVDLFCGAGGMSLGFKQAGFHVSAAVDVDENNVHTHRKNFPDCFAWQADLSEVSGERLRRETGIHSQTIDTVFAGPPCQGFSLIGKRKHSDPRNFLLFDLARLIGELSPSYFVVENVAGILLGSARNTLEEFVQRVETCGYSVVKPIQVLDAAKFGVPQRRRRVFLLGHRAKMPPPAYPTPPASPRKRNQLNSPNVWDAIGDLPRIGEYEYLYEDDTFLGKLGEPSHYARILRGEIEEPENRRPNEPTNGNGLSGCLRTRHSDETIRRFRGTKQGCTEKVSRFYRLSKNGLAPTQRAGTGPAQGSFMAPRPIHPFQDRCITVREAARLHSFPDWFQFHPTKWHGFRQIGNSVPPILARAVAMSIKRALATL